MTREVKNVLFLCTGNSARSILAEAILNSPAVSQGKFRAHSAGSFPKGHVHPVALDLLRDLRLPTDALRSKPWEEFATAGAPKLDFIITVCDNAAGEVCPIWPGRPTTAHWGIEDPAAAEGTAEQKRQAFVQAERQLRSRIERFVELPFDQLDSAAMKKELAAIAQQPA